MKVKRDFSRHTVSLSPQSYIWSLLERFALQNAQTVAIPLAPGTILTKDQWPKTPDEVNDMADSKYRELIGSIQYASLATRPDIIYTVNKLAQFLANPGRAHLDAALRVLHYLKRTRHRSLHLGGGIPDIAGFSDSDWEGDHDNRKSTGAHIFVLDSERSPESRKTDADSTFSGGIGGIWQCARRRRRPPGSKVSWKTLVLSREALSSFMATTRMPLHLR